MSDNEMPVGGDCKNKIELFSSEYMSVFDKESYLEEKEDATAHEVAAVSHEHAKRHALAVAVARNVCGGCSKLEECNKWVMSFPEEVYGVVAGMTNEERFQYKSNRATAPTNAIETFTHPQGGIVNQVSLQLMESYSSKKQ